MQQYYPSLTHHSRERRPHAKRTTINATQAHAAIMRMSPLAYNLLRDAAEGVLSMVNFYHRTQTNALTRKIEAIRDFREVYYCGLKDAKDTVEQLMALPTIPEYIDAGANIWRIGSYNGRRSIAIAGIVNALPWPVFIDIDNNHITVAQLYEWYLGRYYQTIDFSADDHLYYEVRDRKSAILLARFATQEGAEQYVDYMEVMDS